MKAEQFEQQFDEEIDITASLDLLQAKRVLQAQKRVNVDVPTCRPGGLPQAGDAGKRMNAARGLGYSQSS